MFIARLLTLVVAVVNCSWQPIADIIFQDCFDGSNLDKEKWIVQTGNTKYGEKRLMCFQEENIEVANGTLILTARPETVFCHDKKANVQYTSARIKTKDKFNYTAIEFVARVSKGEHLQPGLWTQYSNSTLYEEVDVMEVKGTETWEYRVNAHWGKDYSHLVKKPKDLKPIKSVGDLSNGFHRYGIEKTQSQLQFYFDDELKQNLTTDKSEWNKPNKPDMDVTPFSEPAYVLISLLVSGNWFKDKLTQEIAKTWEKPTLEVDIVTVYGEKKIEKTSASF